MSENARSDRRRSSPSDALEVSELLDTLRLRRGLVLGIFAAVVAGGMCWTVLQPPVYRASAIVKLESKTQGSGVLSDLASLTAAPATEGEMSILRSRSLLAETAADPALPREHAAPFTPTAADAFHLDEAIELGLGTRVEAQNRLPIHDLLRWIGLDAARGERLFARLDPLTDDAPRKVRVSFVGTDRVRISIPGGSGILDQDVVERPYVRGGEIEYRGARLRLEATGDFAGSEHVVERLAAEGCIESLAGSVDVEETSRNSGVIRVSVSDSDPARAAEVANALCHNYLLRSIRIGRMRADRTLEFIDGQLAEQQRLLQAAESEVAELQSANPDLIQVVAVATSLLQRLAELEGERGKVSLARAGLAEAVRLLEAGDRQALARLSQELPDLVSLGYIEAIGKLGAESLALERGDAGASKTLLAQKLDELARERHEADTRLAALENALKALRAGRASALATLFAEAPDLAAMDPATARYVSECARIDTEISTLGADLTSANPTLRDLVAARGDLERKITLRLESAAVGLRIAAADRSALESGTRAVLEAWPVEERARIDVAVAELVQRVAGNLHARVESLASREAALEGEIAGVERELGDLPRRERAVADPLRRREAHAEIVKLLLDSRQQARLSAAATLPAANLIDPAIPATSRHAPRLAFHLVLFAVVGLCLGILSALVRQAISGAMYSAAELEDCTGLSVFGAIPDFRRSRPWRLRQGEGFLALRDEPDGLLAEAYRSVRENLRSACSAERPLRTLGFTSCVPGEGKTTTNVNLALACANAERRVLLVDADLRRSSVAECLGIPAGPGFGEILDGRARWQECLVASGHAGLDVLCAGASTTSPSELFTKARLHVLLAEWTLAYDMVLLDLPPTLAVADVEVLARELDGIVLLYRGGGVHRDVLRSAVRRLQRSGARVLGCVLNAVHASRAEAAVRGYGDAYAYGAGPGRDKRRRRARPPLQEAG